MKIWEKLYEELDVKKLHEPEQFSEESEKFIRETNAQLKMLLHFAQQQNSPELAKAIQGVQKSMTHLEQQAKQVNHLEKAKKQAAQPAGKVFKR